MANSEQGKTLYIKGHIPDAQYLGLETDVIAYDNLFSLASLGRDDAILYVGNWSD